MMENTIDKHNQPLQKQFVSGLGNRSAEISDSEVQLEKTLQKLVIQCQAAWPDIQLPPQSFVAYCAQRIPEDQSIEKGLQQVSTDLWLAYACLQGYPNARREYEKILEQLTIPIHNALGLASDRRQDVIQHLRELLEVGKEKRPPVLLQYQGRCRIKTWLRKIVKHHTLRMIKERPHYDIDDIINLDAFCDDDSDPERNIIKNQSKSAFRKAFRKAVSELTPEERSLLRFVVVDGLTGAQIALILQCDASTVSRNLRKIRDRLARTTRKLISQTWRDSPKAMQSIFNVVDSQLHATFADLLVSKQVE